MERRRFFKDVAIITGGMIIAPNLLLTNCGPIGPVVVATAEFVFPLLFRVLTGEVISRSMSAAFNMTCNAYIKNQAICEQLTTVFDFINSGTTMKKVNQGVHFNWSLYKAGKDTFLSFGVDTLSNAIDIVTIAENRTNNECNNSQHKIEYVKGIGSYPMVSSIRICDNNYCYPIENFDNNTLRVVQAGILARNGYRFSENDPMYDVFIVQPWYSLIPQYLWTYDINVALANSSPAKDNYNQLEQFITNRNNVQSGMEPGKLYIENPKTGGMEELGNRGVVLDQPVSNQPTIYNNSQQPQGGIYEPQPNVQLSAVLYGKVSDEMGQGIASVSVVIDASRGLGMISDYNGNYMIEVPSGSYQVIYKYVGRQTQSVYITLQPGVNTNLNVIMPFN